MFKFHHLGIVTSDLEQTTEFYNIMGYRKIAEAEDPIQKAQIVLLESMAGEPLLELIRPIDKDSPSHSWLTRIKAGPYHTCYETNSLNQATAELELRGFKMVTELAPALIFDNRNIVFFWSSKVGLVELLEAKR